jgi:hypothetical protein
MPCGRCRRPVGADDSGVTMPNSDGPVTFHLACYLKSVLPHTSWPAAGLVPDDTDGLVDGFFQCASCGMAYAPAIGWTRGVRPPAPSDPS